jgi:hypothetical protein
MEFLIMAGCISPLTQDHLCEALYECKGFLHASKKYIKEKWGYSVDTETMKRRIELLGLQGWLDDIRKDLVEQCFRKTYAKAVEDGDKQCMFWILDKYGHYVNFLEPMKEKADSEKGWKVILQRVKQNIEPDTEEEHS